MANIVTPQTQSSHINPFSGKVFEYDTISSKYYLARTINENLLCHGTDCIISGMDVKQINSNELNHNIEVVISAGRVIADMTLIDIDQDVTLNIDVTSLEDNGKLIVFLSYRFLETPNSNFAKLKVFYVSENTLNTIPEQFQTDYERIALCELSFIKTTNGVSNVVNTEVNYKNQKVITVKGKPYNLRNMSNLKKSTLDFMFERFKLIDM